MQTIISCAQKYKKHFVGAISIVFLSVIAGFIPYFIANRLVIAMLNRTADIKYILVCAALIAALLILKAILGGIGITLSHKGAYGTLYEMRRRFSDKLESLPLGEITDNGSGVYKKKLVEDIGSMEVALAHIIPEAIPNLVVPLIGLAIIFISDWRMGLLSLVSIIIGLIAMIGMMSSGMKLLPGFYKAEGQLNNTIIEYISGMDIIKIFGQTTSSYKKYINDVSSYRKYNYEWSKSSWTSMAVIGVVLPCTILLPLPIGTLMYMHGSITLETLVFTLMLDLGIGIPLNYALMFLPQLPHLNQTVKSLETVFGGKSLQIGDIMKKPEHYDIQFDGVTFAYKDVNVINSLSLKMKENTLTAIVGPSGGGKSTIAKLLVHYWDIAEGTIKIGGKDIRDFTPDTLADMISFVSQDNFLFDDSIMGNIRVGNPKATDMEVIAAAKAAACDEFISRLPEGYFTKAGAAGDKLSGGERQRITIARAILKNAPILVLDEATAFADAENEDLIQEAINNLMSDKTIIVIAHRLRSIVGADQILVMDKGKLAANGTHGELLESCDLYKSLWSANEETANWRLEV